jgi:hypothetical protein
MVDGVGMSDLPLNLFPLFLPGEILINLKSSAPKSKSSVFNVLVFILEIEVGSWLETDAFVLKTIIFGGSNHTPMDHLVTIFSQYIESHSIPDIIGNADPPPRFFFGGWKAFVSV